MRALLFRAGKSCNLKLRRGVYLAVSGPSYETPAEIRAFARLGADAVGMSTVPEAIVARQCGLNVAAVSCITNLAAGISQEKLSHAEVLETAERVKTLAAKLLKQFRGIVWAKVDKQTVGAGGGQGAGTRGGAVFQIQGRRGAAHERRRNHFGCERGKRELRFDVLRGARGAVQGADGRQERILSRWRWWRVRPAGRCRAARAGSCWRNMRRTAKVWVADSRAPGRIREFTVRELLPSAFVIP